MNSTGACQSIRQSTEAVKRSCLKLINDDMPRWDMDTYLRAIIADMDRIAERTVDIDLETESMKGSIDTLDQFVDNLREVLADTRTRAWG